VAQQAIEDKVPVGIAAPHVLNLRLTGPRAGMSGPGVVVGVDLGTSTTKVLAFTLQGRTVAAATEGYPPRWAGFGWTAVR